MVLKWSFGHQLVFVQVAKNDVPRLSLSSAGAGEGGAAQGAGREADALARLAHQEAEMRSRLEKNNFKCPLCHRVRVPQCMPHCPVLKLRQPFMYDRQHSVYWP